MMAMQPQPSAARPAFAIMLIGGGVLMLLAILSSLILSVWSQAHQAAGEQWNDIIVIIGIVFVELPTFIIGLLLVLVGWMRNARGKRKITLAGK